MSFFYFLFEIMCVFILDFENKRNENSKKKKKINCLCIYQRKKKTINERLKCPEKPRSILQFWPHPTPSHLRSSCPGLLNI